MSDWFDVGDAGDFADGEVAPAMAGGQPVAVFRIGEELFALKDLCTHGNARLSDGYVEDGCVECPLHQGLFDIRSGAARCAPVTEAVRSFPVRVVAGRVEVGMEAQAQNESAPVVRKLHARIAGITRAAPDVAVLELHCQAEADSAAEAFVYQAGQYVDVLLDDGQRRSYSMATPAAASAGLHTIELHVRHLPGGLFTDRVFNGMQAGDMLQLEGPGGSFYLREGDAPLVLLASGTGFAPIKALVEEAIANNISRPMRLYWGGRRQADLYMDVLCREWAARFPWFEYVPVLSEPDIPAGKHAQSDQQDEAGTPACAWSGRTGFVHLAVMQDLPDLRRYQVYACGAPVVVESARRDFTARCGLADADFFADAFLSKADGRA